jgi:4-amino-4-deoxy-L-arabinose transferase-like glycosyltransferase
MDLAGKFERVKRWFLENRTRQLFFLVLLVTLVVRLYYFWLTKGQPLWYDEGEYLIQARHLVTGLPNTGYWWGRPPLFTWVTSVFFFFGTAGGELLTRVFLAASSVGSVWMMFLLGKEIHSEEVGLLSSVFVSASWILLFLTFRILVELPLFFLLLLSAWFFVRYDRTEQPKWFWLAIAGAVLSFLMKWSAGMLLVIFPLYVLLKRKGKFWERKHERNLFALAGLAFLGYLVYAATKGGGLLYAFEKIKLPFFTGGDSLWPVVMQQVGFLQGFLGAWWLWIIGAALIWGAGVVLLHYGVIFKEKKTRVLFFLLLWTVLFFAAFVFIKAWENRYVIPLLIPFYLLTSMFALEMAQKLKQYKQLVMGVIVILVLIGSYGQLVQGDALTRNKLGTYIELKEAGQWLAKHTERGDVIISGGRPQLTHYTELENLIHADNLTTELEMVRERDVKYIVIGSWEKSPEWMYPYLLGSEQQEFVPVFQSIRDYGGRKMFAIVFEPTPAARAGVSLV